jgi:DNA-binding GntR family transcriptional regulator
MVAMKGRKTSLYETLKRNILTLELAPDEDLDEVSLSEEYGISRTPVRDVLRQLAAEGYVDIRENRGARVIPMNLVTLRDFFLVAPIIYEAVGRLAVQNFRPAQLAQLKDSQKRFRTAMKAREVETMALENKRFHEIIGEMADSAFLKPSLGKVLIDHARIGRIFYRPTDERMEANLQTACRHHDEIIAAIADRDEAALARLVHDHWELGREGMEMFVVPRKMKSHAVGRISKATSPERWRGRRRNAASERSVASS